MCGISGAIAFSSENSNELSSLLDKSLEIIAHRGPDAKTQKNFEVNDKKVFLGHRRLAIQDLSENGAQPMSSRSGRYQIVYNGEIYNFLKIKKQLEDDGVSFKGHSDTEVFLALVEKEGVKSALSKCFGMFAMALLDLEERKLFLVRDRAGEKPLYYGIVDNSFLFASELKAFRPFFKVRPKVSQMAIQQFMQKCYIPTPLSIYEGIHKLLPGSFLEIDLNKDQNSLKNIDPYTSPKIFWLYSDCLNKGEIDNSDHLSRLDSVLKEVISEQMISDVPYGAFLSGGIDSSLVVSLMQNISTRPVNTFSIGFEEKDYNEADWAKKISKHLGTNHSEVYLKANDLLELVPKVSSIWDEPFADSSQIPTWYVSQIAKRDVTVCLSGDAGDEVFGGYNRHFFLPSLYQKSELLGGVFSKVIASSLTSFRPSQIDSMYSLFKGKKSIRSLGDKVHQVAKIFDSKTFEQAYTKLISLIYPATSVLENKQLLNYKYWFDSNELNSLALPSQVMALDFLTYMMDDILVKVDRASMSHSLETRVPFLDERVLNFAASLPVEQKISGHSGKLILKRLLSKYVPVEYFDRPKAGFAVPIDSWLRNELKDWMLDLLNADKLKNQQLFDHDEVQRLIDEHLQMKTNNQYKLWNLLIFQQWYTQEC